MKGTKYRPIGIKLFPVVIILFVLYYYISQIIYPLHIGEVSVSWFLQFPNLLFFCLDLILIIILLYAVTYGFYKVKNWARLYTIFCLSLFSLFALLMIFWAHWKVIERYIFFVIYVILIMYLLMSPVKEYFRKGSKPGALYEKDDVYKYGEYTLYKKDVKLRSGRTQTIYFFSRRIPVSGKPCDKPDNLIVNINPRTGMPYLKKKQ